MADELPSFDAGRFKMPDLTAGKPPATPDLVAFLRARLDAREDRALAAQGTTEGRWKQDAPDHEPGRVLDDYGDVVTYDEGAPSEAQARHIADNDPAFALADIEAKRQLLHEHGDDGMWRRAEDGSLVRHGPLGDRCSTCLDTTSLAAGAGSEFAEMAPYPCRTLRLLAQPYAGHPEYREEWKA